MDTDITLIRLPWKCAFCGKLFNPTTRQKIKVCKSCRPLRRKCMDIINNFNNGNKCKNPNCTNKFITTNNKLVLLKHPWKKDYCSFQCYGLNSHDYVKKQCFKCGNEFPIHKKYKDAVKVFCSTLCRGTYLKYQKCTKCGRTFPDKKIRPVCLDCLFEEFTTKCNNCGKTLKKNRKRIITQENYDILLKTYNFNPKKLTYFKISNMQYCNINCAIEKETPYYYKGISAEEYPPEFNRYLKREIMERDGNKCQLCPTNYNLAVHHIDYNKQNIDPTNLITLCTHHHMKTNWNRKYWVDLFSNYQLWRGFYD